MGIHYLRKPLLACAIMFAALGAHAQFAQTPPPGFLPNNPLPVPDLLPGPNFDLHMVEAQHTFWPGQTPVHTMAYQHPGNTTNSWLGPTLVWNRGTNVSINVNNHLPDTTTNHWHGAHIPSYWDGGPHQPIAPNSVWSPSFEVLDSSATQWYHPHLHHETFMQVQMGLAGMVFVNDPQDPYQNQLPHTYGVDEIPIIVQDRNFFQPSNGPYQIDTLCSVGPNFMVNGKLRPTVTLPKQMVKFRILSAGSERSFNIGVWNSLTDTVQTTYQIATDAGYIQAPLATDYILLGVGERAELLLDLSSFQVGDTLYLVNNTLDIPSDFPGGPSLNNPPCYGPVSQTNPSPNLNNYSGIQDSSIVPILRIIVGPNTAGAITTKPNDFSQYQLAIPSSANPVRRDKKLTNWNGTHDAPPPFQIDNTPFRMDYVNDFVRLGDVEYWSFKNQTGTTHPMHIHDVHFFITEIRDTSTGQNQPIPPYLQGPKDVMMARSGYKYTFVTQFLDFAIKTPSADSAYMYHCHILPHEDGVMPQPGDTTFNGGMMHQFVVMDSTVAIPLAGAGPVAEVQMAAFPNPMHDKLYLRGQYTKSSTVRIISTDGRLIQVLDIPAIHGDMELPIQPLAPGMYFLEWVRKDGISTKKIVVQ